MMRVKGDVMSRRHNGRFSQTAFDFRKSYTTGTSVEEYDPPADRNEDDEIEEKELKVTALKVKAVDLKVASNAVNHETSQYEMTEETKGDNGDIITPKLVVRRGKEFTIVLTFDREMVPDQDKIRINLQIGDKPLVSKGTSIQLTPGYMLKPRKWSCSEQGRSGDKLTLAILSPSTCVVGRWSLAIETWLSTDADKPKIMRYTHKDPVYIIFNPFCKDDQVYMPDEVDLDEYVMNDSGKIFVGNKKQITYKPWNFGQFENRVLECCVELLDLSKLNLQCRSDAVLVVRKISAIVNSSDDSGVLVGNWSGDYSDGTAPTHWVGSAAILEEYFRTREPVKYGQCWVFSGITTTVCRALGIPARSVTNFESAHDCDGSISIDVHWNDQSQPIDNLNFDSIWNFHVWNEVYMTRPDLGPQYAGWQVIDATPQETSAGVHCAGPMPVSALKEGQVNLPYDGRFIFAEVNADRVHWISNSEQDDADDIWRKVIQKNVVGHKISTKRQRKAKSTWRSSMHADEKDRVDLSDCYKHPENTEAERAAVLKANCHSSRSDIYDQGEADVKFELRQKDNMLVGNAFDVTLRAQNTSRQPRSIHAIMTLRSTHYTGHRGPRGPLKKLAFDFNVPGIRAEDQVMRVSFDEYQHHIVDGIAFEIDVLATVHETGQVAPLQEVYRLRRPDLTIEAPASVRLGQTFDVTIKLASPMPIHLSKCEWMVDAPGLKKMEKLKQKDLEPYDRVDQKITLRANKLGEKCLAASFDSLELRDVVGSTTIHVQE